MILNCDARHYFHYDCAQQWLQTHTTCPLCRKNCLDENGNANADEADPDDEIEEVEEEELEDIEEEKSPEIRQHRRRVSEPPNLNL